MDEQTFNLLRTLMTVISFMVFVGVVLWAYSARNRSRFDEAAQLPFMEDETAVKEVSHG